MSADPHCLSFLFLWDWLRMKGYRSSMINKKRLAIFNDSECNHSLANENKMWARRRPHVLPSLAAPRHALFKPLGQRACVLDWVNYDGAISQCQV